MLWESTDPDPFPPPNPRCNLAIYCEGRNNQVFLNPHQKRRIFTDRMLEAPEDKEVPALPRASCTVYSTFPCKQFSETRDADTPLSPAPPLPSHAKQSCPELRIATANLSQLLESLLFSKIIPPSLPLPWPTLLILRPPCFIGLVSHLSQTPICLFDPVNLDTANTVANDTACPSAAKCESTCYYLG